MPRAALTAVFVLGSLHAVSAEAGDFPRTVSEAIAAVKTDAAQTVGSPAKPPGPRTHETTLRVLTYNINGLPRDDEASHERYAKIGRILYALRQEGAAPHVVTIQEAFHPRTSELVDEADYPYFRYGARGSSESPLPSGLIVLSEFPIETASTIDYSDCLGWDCWANKGAQHVRIKVPGLPHPVEIYDTHMNANSRNDPIEAGKVRAKQVAQLAAFFAFSRAPGAPAVLAGDFNFKPGRPEYAAFAAIDGARNAAERCAATGACAGGSDPDGIWRKSVDHHFYFAGASPEVLVEPVRIEQTFRDPVDGGPLSDHWGLEAHYRLSW